MKAIKFLLGLLLLPVCGVMTAALYRILMLARPESLHQVAPPTWGLLFGFFFWVVLFFSMPRPLRTYVLGHELTHALWAVLMGGRASQLKVSRKGGSVMVSKTNVLVTLAPYFFPFYTFLVLALYLVLALFLDLRHYEPFWMGCVGLTWSFHLTFTLTMLGSHQTDIVEHGRTFSYVFIYFMNVAGLCLWVVAVGPAGMEDLEREIGGATRDALHWASRIAASKT